MGLVMSLLIIAFGAIFQLSLFLHNSFGILFFLFFLFQLAMASFAFLCSIPIRKVGIQSQLTYSLRIVCSVSLHFCITACLFVQPCVLHLVHSQRIAGCSLVVPTCLSVYLCIFLSVCLSVGQLRESCLSVCPCVTAI